MADQSPATTFTLEEEGGSVLQLRERALPYRPVSIQGKQRAEFTWYPGNPEATVQMLGPDEGTIQLRGYWKDRFLQGTDMAMQVAAGAYIRGQTFTGTISNVSELVQLVDRMRRTGRRITLTWDTLVRVGHITSFTQTWHNTHDVEWEIEFSVLSQGEVTVPTANTYVQTAADNYYAMQQAMNAYIASKQLKTVTLTPLDKLNKAMAEFEASVFSATQAFKETAYTITQYALLPGEAVRRTVAIASGAISSCSLFVGSTIDRALAECVEFGYYGDEDKTPFGIQLSASSWQKNVRNTIKSIQYNNAISRAAAQRQLNEQQTKTHVASDKTDLRDLSTRYYGTPDEWRSLMIYNNLTSSALIAGQVIYIPPAPNSAGAGTPYSTWDI